jgi:hypothetical protein
MEAVQSVKAEYGGGKYELNDPKLVLSGSK